MNSILIERAYLGLGRYFSRANRRNPLAKNLSALGRDRDNIGYLTKKSIYLYGSSSRPAGAELVRSPNWQTSFRQRYLNRHRQAPLDES
jgi:hypothetical protein